MKGSRMRLRRKHQEYEPPYEHDRVLLFVCFLATSLIGYVLMNHVALLGA
jgi:hypothetical protein